MSPPGERVAPGPGGFRVVIVKPQGYAHSGAFREVAETVAGGLRDLGFAVDLKVNRFAPGRTHVLLGWNLLSPADAASIPAGTVLYNLEQVTPDSPWLTPERLTVLRSHRVWDYSARNLERLRGLDVEDAALLPIGYVPELTRISPATGEDVDVLFYGSLSPRRQAILEGLAAAGMRAAALHGVYGPPRDAMIARAKVVLSLHYYASRVFEIVRVSYLLANGRAVVAECDDDTEIDPDIRAGVSAVPYEGLVAACRTLVDDPAGRRELGERALAVMRGRPESELLRPLVGS